MQADSGNEVTYKWRLGPKVGYYGLPLNHYRGDGRVSTAEKLDWFFQTPLFSTA